MSSPGALATGMALGMGLGALLLRPNGWGARALATGAWKGGLIGTAAGAALIGVDVLTDGTVKRQLDLLALDRRHQIGFVLRHPLRPWLAPLGLRVADDANATQNRYFGAYDPADGAPDAFRHTFAAGLFTLRAMRDHGVSAGDAAQLAIAAGEAHEADGQDNNDSFSRSMDSHNNHVGAGLIGDGRAQRGESADDQGWLTDRGVAERALAAIGRGDVHVVDRSDRAAPQTRVTSRDDLSMLQSPSGER